MLKPKDQAIEKLLSGHQNFYKKYFEKKTVLFKKLVKLGQQPKILLIACSDSRVDPSIILDCQPGDLFVIRNVANLVPPFEKDKNTYHGTSAAIEFAVCQLGVQHIIVMGHTQCGGMQALVRDYQTLSTDQQTFIYKWIGIAKNALDKTQLYHSHVNLSEKTDICSQYALIQSLENLKTFPFVSTGLQAQTLSLHAWQFDLLTGKLYLFNQATQCFERA